MILFKDYFRPNNLQEEKNRIEQKADAGDVHPRQGSLKSRYRDCSICPRVCDSITRADTADAADAFYASTSLEQGVVRILKTSQR